MKETSEQRQKRLKCYIGNGINYWRCDADCAFWHNGRCDRDDSVVIENKVNGQQLHRWEIDKNKYKGYRYDPNGGFVSYEVYKELKESYNKIKEECNDYKRWCDIHANNFIKCIDLLHEYRYALRQSNPFTLTTGRGLNNCEFCHQKEHIEGCDYKKLINFDFNNLK